MNGLDNVSTLVPPGPPAGMTAPPSARREPASAVASAGPCAARCTGTVPAAHGPVSPPTAYPHFTLLYQPRPVSQGARHCRTLACLQRHPPVKRSEKAIGEY
jgi:hypothetical protein